MTYLNEQLFKGLADSDDKRALFKKYVNNVIVELSSYCNRKCGYCPVAYSDRNEVKSYLNKDILSTILSDLAEISYDESICFNLYNEPMADFSYLISNIKKFRKNLPDANIYFSTNGDYLNRERLVELFDAGLSSLIISIHMPNSKPYDDKYIISRFSELSARCQTRINIRTFQPGSCIYGDLKYKAYPIEVFSLNFYEKGSNRAGSLDNIRASSERTAPCIRPFNDLTISYDGTIYPCCQFYADDEEAKKFVIGKLDDDRNIFDVYSSEAMATWREALFSTGPKASPCDTCGEINWRLEEEEIALRDEFIEKNMMRNRKKE